MKSSQELLNLTKRRDELIKEVRDYRDQLIQLKSVKYEPKVVDINKLHELPPEDKKMSFENRFPKRVVEAAKNVTGISYKEVDKLWQKDNIWLYKATVVMKILKFKVELTIKQEADNATVLDITCHFVEVDSCILQELTPWVNTLTKEMNFSYLMSVFSDYNEQCLCRNKMLSTLKRTKYGTLEKNSKEGGGVIIFIHSPKKPKQSIAEYLWQLQFHPKLRSVNHIFSISNINDDFVDINGDLLQRFCKNGLKKQELENLWDELYIAIDKYI